MQCQEVRQLLSAYMDEQLEALQKEDVSAHLRECTVCVAELAEMQQAVNLLRQLPELSPPPQFRTRLSEQIAAKDLSPSPARPPRSFFLQRWVRFVAAAAVIFLTVGITTLLYGLPSPWGHKDLTQNSVQEDAAAKEQLTASTDLRHRPESNVVQAPESSNQRGPLESFNAGDSVKLRKESRQTEAIPPEKEDGPTPSSGIEPRGGQGGGQSAGENDRQVSIMALPAEDDSGDMSPAQPDDSPQMGISAVPEEDAKLPAKLPEAVPEAVNEVGNAMLTLQVQDFNQALNMVNNIVEKYSGEVIRREEKTLELQFPAAIYDKAVMEMKSMGKVLESQTKDAVSVKYQKINDKLQALLKEKNDLLQKENITPVEKERLEDMQNSIDEYSRQLQDVNKLITVNFN